MIRFLTPEYVREKFDTRKFSDGSAGNALIINEKIWDEGRKLFRYSEQSDILPVRSGQHKLICFAWQDREANRELRMLQELETCDHALNFLDLFPNCKGVIIHDCNELAWYTARYLGNIGVPVRVEGSFWELFPRSNRQYILEDCNYEIWAEGVSGTKEDWKYLRLRSASVEFELINKIYEANIKAGRIRDTEGNVEELLARLKKEKEIVIRGLGTRAQDAYDWLMANDINICAFQSDRAGNKQKSLFEIPVLKKSEVAERFKEAVIIECGSMHSAWGFGEVDDYDYYGYKRNKNYLLLRDYVNVPNSNLEHILVGKRVILTGEARLCNRVYRWLKQNEKEIHKIKYWDILKENRDKNSGLPKTEIEEQCKEDVLILVLPRHFFSSNLSKEALEQPSCYYEAFEKHDVFDFTEYFSDIDKMVYLETEYVKYHHRQLCPGGILLGAIPVYCGNELTRDCLQGVMQPQIIMINYNSENGLPLFFDIELYSICIRLAEEAADDILPEFWKIYEKETAKGLTDSDFPERKKFECKMEQLLKLGSCFSSQELFVMFHLAHLAMYDKEVPDMREAVIYWEPHWMPREYVRKFAHWLHCDDVKGNTIIMVRNRYIVAGSSIRGNLKGLNWISGCGSMYNFIMAKSGIAHTHWAEHVIRFEDLKCHPGKILKELNEWLGLSSESVLMETNQEVYNHNERNDLKPAYNLYEEYFSGFDRMRISLAAANYQKQYGYPYESCLRFSRRELQEMYLKEYRWERLPGALEGKSEGNIDAMQHWIRKLLWMQRFSEVMEVVLDEEF